MAPGTEGSGNTTRTKVSPSAGASSPSIVKGKGMPSETRSPPSWSRPITIRQGDENQRERSTWRAMSRSTRTASPRKRFEPCLGSTR